MPSCIPSKCSPFLMNQEFTIFDIFGSEANSKNHTSDNISHWSFNFFFFSFFFFFFQVSISVHRFCKKNLKEEKIIIVAIRDYQAHSNNYRQFAVLTIFSKKSMLKTWSSSPEREHINELFSFCSLTRVTMSMSKDICWKVTMFWCSQIKREARTLQQGCTFGHPNNAAILKQT